MRSGWWRGSIYWALLFRDWFAVTKPLSQIQRSALWPLQDADPTPSFGGFGFTTTSLEEFLGSVLYEVPVQEGDEQRPGHYDEKRPPGHSGCMLSLFHKDVPDWQSRIAQHFPETAANSCRKQRRGDRRWPPAATKLQTCWCRSQRTHSSAR